jgi:hypothetical protein
MAYHRVFNIIPPRKLIQSIHKSVEYLTFQEAMAYYGLINLRYQYNFLNDSLYRCIYDVPRRKSRWLKHIEKLNGIAYEAENLRMLEMPGLILINSFNDNVYFENVFGNITDDTELITINMNKLK